MTVQIPRQRSHRRRFQATPATPKNSIVEQPLVPVSLDDSTYRVILNCHCQSGTKSVKKDGVNASFSTRNLNPFKEVKS